MQKRYNLATPELISKLIEVGALTDDTLRNASQLLYRVRIRTKFVNEVNQLLTGSTFIPLASGWYCIYSKDVWHALQHSNDRRTTYGHELKPGKQRKDKSIHCGLSVNKFTFSDGSIIRKCALEACTHFDTARQIVLREPMKGAR